MLNGKEHYAGYFDRHMSHYLHRVSHRCNSKLVVLVVMLLFKRKALSEQLQSNPGRSIEDVVVDTKLSTVKPLHARTMTKAYGT